MNPFLIDMLGYSHEEFIEKYLWEVSPFKDTALNKEAFAKLQQAGYVRYEDLPLETSDGRRIAVEFVSNSYPVNGKTFIQCNIRDITKRKHAVEAAKQLTRNGNELSMPFQTSLWFWTTNIQYCGQIRLWLTPLA